MDNDGEFLLIEGADYLPAWLEPETAYNRVWELEPLFLDFLHMGIQSLFRKPFEASTPKHMRHCR